MIMGQDEDKQNCLAGQAGGYGGKTRRFTILVTWIMRESYLVCFIPVVLMALPADLFTKALLNKKAAQAREYQTLQNLNPTSFFELFFSEQQKQIMAVLKTVVTILRGLSSEELAGIWRNSVWR